MATRGKKNQPRVPTSVTIGGRRVKIVFAPLEDCWGDYSHDDGCIRLNAERRNDFKAIRETLRHEMMEAALLISGVAWMERYDQEPVVRAMEEIFFPAWEKIEPKLRHYVR